MKNILKITFAALLFATVAMAQGCEKIPTDDGLYVMPADAGTIAGPEGYYEGETAELVAAEISYATSYRWYNGNDVIPDAAERTLTVSEPGLYRVAGVNEIGEGRASEAKPMRLLTFTDRWVGKWNSTDIILKYKEDGSGGFEWFSANHIVNITRYGELSDNMIVIVDFFGANPEGLYSAFAPIYRYNGRTIYASGDTVIAEVDEETGAMQIVTQELTPTWDPGFTTMLCPMLLNSSFADNVGLKFPLQTLVEQPDGMITMTMKTGNIISEFGPDKTKYPETYMIATTSIAAGFEKYARRVFNTQWTKIKEEY